MKKTLLLVVVAALVFAATAAAKGPSQATISGPGLSSTMTITGDGEPDSNTTDLGLLVDQTGFFAEVFGQYPSPLLRAAPRNRGPSFTVTYTVPGSPTSKLVQELYPYAVAGPVSHLRPRQRFWGNQETVGGWFRGSAELKAMLVRNGLPQVAATPVRRRAGMAHGYGIATAAGLLLAAGALTVLRRRG